MKSEERSPRAKLINGEWVDPGRSHAREAGRLRDGGRTRPKTETQRQPRRKSHLDAKCKPRRFSVPSEEPPLRPAGRISDRDPRNGQTGRRPTDSDSQAAESLVLSTIHQ